jgi:cell division septum initiation protein DivIVA
MAQDAEKVKRLVTFKKRLEKKVEELESELKETQATLETVNLILLEKGFKRAEITEAPTAKEILLPEEEAKAELVTSSLQPTTEPENVMPLETVTGDLLANLYITEDSLRVVPAEDKDFNVNTPPFTHFLVERVFTKMQEKNGELAKTGQLTPEKIFSYSINRDGDIIREIIIKHVDSDRLRELKSSIRWTLEKMYEKMKTQS